MSQAPKFKKTYIIAEAGVNHNGDLELAKNLVRAAAEAGADAVKFQTFKAQLLATKDLSKADYQIKNDGSGESQYQMLERLELSYENHRSLLDLCNQENIDFMSSTFDEESTNFLCDELKCKTIKVGSGELTNSPLLLHLAQKEVKVILSTGMSTLSDIEQALGVLAYGYLYPKAQAPSIQEFQKAFYNEEGYRKLLENVTLLHCTSDYPCPPEDVNLLSITTLKNAFLLPVGFSDHTEGVHISVASIALGAHIIEKHFTIDKSLPGPDHKASLTPLQLKDMISQIRDIEDAKGTGRKVPSKNEIKTSKLVRKSIIASRNLDPGEIIHKRDLTILRSSHAGASPLYYWHFLGKKMLHSVEAGQPINLHSVE